jgi:hypothetical protein
MQKALSSFLGKFAASTIQFWQDKQIHGKVEDTSYSSIFDRTDKSESEHAVFQKTCQASPGKLGGELSSSRGL